VPPTASRFFEHQIPLKSRLCRCEEKAKTKVFEAAENSQKGTNSLPVNSEKVSEISVGTFVGTLDKKSDKN
jgi:hypothetical protein